MSEFERTVYIVDDDPAVCDALAKLVETVDFNVKTFSTAQEFLDSYDSSQPACLILDVRMPGMSGLALQTKLQEDGADIPIIFISGHGDVAMATEALRGGAVDFIEKPFRNQVLLDRINEAFSKADKTRQIREDREAARAKLELLTPREREVMELVKSGKSSRVIAEELGLSQKTVEVHRSSIMKKVAVNSVVELVALAYVADSGQ